MFRSLLIAVSCVAAIGFSSLASAEEKPSARKPDAAQLDFFEKRIRPLFAKHCQECHSTDEAKDNGELDLETIAGIARGGTRGSMWKGRDADASLLIKVIRYEDPDLQMPPEGKLSAADVELVAAWIRTGAALPAYKAQARPAEAGIDYDKARRFWSFRPLADHQPPDVADSTRVKRNVDRFLLKRLESESFSLNPQADRRTLIRRLSFDLTGLPPTPEAVAEFVADNRPDAYERLVDRLLDSPQYGERWARVWLDLARYTDTTASWLKSTGQAWLYRDWVIDAFNRNLPYDEFVRLQLAGDLIPGTEPKDLAALGFLGLSPTYWKELKLAPDVIKQVVAEEWDERIDAVSRTFLGLTASCARCHDHKFDPITMQDYYSLAGVFASTQLHDRPMLPDDEATVVRQARSEVTSLEAQLAKIKEKESPEAKALKEKINQIKTETPHYNQPWMHIVREASIYIKPQGTDATQLEYQENAPRDLPLFHRGNPANPGDIMPRGFPLLFSNNNQRVEFQQGSGRRELAESLLTASGPLTARVIVNRIWAEHFGQGLVRTVSDFGQQGERPTHPELLEWLSAEFVRRGWDIKWLHRELVCSAAYRQSSEFSEGAFGRDPENRLLWRMNRRRLTIEMWRDAMLAVSGNLDPTVGGAARLLDDVANNRRTIYGKIARRELDGMLKLYDFPEPTSHSPRRVPTTTPLQQLFVFNSPFVEQQADALQQQLAADTPLADQIGTCYQRLFARDATADDIAVGLQYLGASDQNAATISVPAKRWSSYLHALLSLNEFLYVD